MNSKTLRTMVATAAFIVATLFAFTPSTQAAGPAVVDPLQPYQPPVISAFTSTTPSLGNAMVLTNGGQSFGTTSNRIVRVNGTNQLVLMAVLGTPANASTSNVVFTVEYTPDGTNWLSTKTNTFTVTFNGTNGVTESTNFPVSFSLGMYGARVKNVTSTAITSYYLTNLVWVRRVGLPYQP